MALRIGTLRKRLLLQSRSTAQDSSGGQSVTWTDVATVWGEIQPLTGHKLKHKWWILFFGHADAVRARLGQVAKERRPQGRADELAALEVPPTKTTPC